MKFTKEHLQEILWEGRGKIIEDVVTDSGRWSIYHRFTFADDAAYPGKIFRTSYSIGATEQQMEQPWEYEDEIECQEVVPVEKTITVYEPAKTTDEIN